MNELINYGTAAWFCFYKVAPIYPVLTAFTIAAFVVVIVVWYEHRRESVKIK